MKDPVICTQRRTVLLPMTILGSSGTPSIDEGATQATVADTGQGIYTVTFGTAFGRAPVVVATPVAATGVELFCIVRDVTVSSFVVEVTDEAGTLTDADVHLMIAGFEIADER